MARKFLSLRGDGREYRLRLTLRGQRNLRDRFQEDTLQTVFLAASDGERMCALLQEALDWPESGNPVTDGEAFYDLLVDWGYHGQERFGALAFDLAAASGLITEAQAAQLKDTLHQAMEQAFAQLARGAAGETGQQPEERKADPFPQV